MVSGFRFFFLLATCITSVLAVKLQYSAKYNGGAGKVTASVEITKQNARVVLDNMYGWSGGAFGANGAGTNIQVYAQADVATKLKALAELKDMAHLVCKHIGVCNSSRELEALMARAALEAPEDDAAWEAREVEEVDEAQLMAVTFEA